jgi:hypothetical protein
LRSRSKRKKEKTAMNQDIGASCACAHRACPIAPAEGDCLSGRSLAMVYSPCQVFEGIYAPDEGLCRGTIFMELEKPFYGAPRLK